MFVGLYIVLAASNPDISSGPHVSMRASIPEGHANAIFRAAAIPGG